MINLSGPPVPSPKKRRRPKKQFKNVLIVALLLLFVIILSRLFIVTSVSKLQILSTQAVSQTTTLEGILIKDEKVVKSPANGRLHLVVPDGKRLEMGAKAAEVIAAEQDFGEVTYDIFTDTTGILCSHLDGLESILSPQNIGVSELPSIEKIVDKMVTEGEKLDKAQPVFKIIDNLSPLYIYGSVPKSAFADGFLDKPEALQASWEDFNFVITPGVLIDAGDNIEGYYLLSEYPEQIIHHRRVSIIVTTRVLKGLLVPDKAIVYRDDRPGIYLAVKKKALWKPVEIEGELFGKVAVSGDGINEGARFVSNPALIREGWAVE